jgi:hypothetical protein
MARRHKYRKVTKEAIKAEEGEEAPWRRLKPPRCSWHRDGPRASTPSLDQQSQSVLGREPFRLVVNVAHRVKTAGTRGHLNKIERDPDLRAAAEIGPFGGPKGGY